MAHLLLWEAQGSADMQLDQPDAMSDDEVIIVSDDECPPSKKRRADTSANSCVKLTKLGLPKQTRGAPGGQAPIFLLLQKSRL